MRPLRIIRIKPNPRRKEMFIATGANPTPAHFGGEWADIMNMSRLPVRLDGLELCHRMQGQVPSQGGWTRILRLAGVLDPEEVIRIHSGPGPDASLLHPEDRAGADHHLFTGRNEYIWGLTNGDGVGLRDSATGQWIDLATYDPNPPQDAALLRIENRLASM
jgi:hypothetical protein